MWSRGWSRGDRTAVLSPASPAQPPPARTHLRARREGPDRLGGGAPVRAPGSMEWAAAADARGRRLDRRPSAGARRLPHRARHGSPPRSGGPGLRLARVADRVAELAPDLVALGGDFVS